MKKELTGAPRTAARLHRLKMTCMVLIAITCAFSLTATGHAADTREPKTSLKEALAKAEKYVEDKRLDVSGLFLFKIYRTEHPKRNGWTVIWAPKAMQVFDGELRVHVHDDGRIEDGGSA